MSIYQLGETSITAIPTTSFAAAGLKERGDLQRLLRDHISVIAPDCLVLAEEFGDWEDSQRRIDLLALDKDANLVVIELKRTNDGGHMELQALRYAAMVSTMTFEQAVDVLTAHFQKYDEPRDARAEILKFLEWDDSTDGVFAKDVRLILASSDFSREVTTTVLWLNQRSMDITCVRLIPYLYGSSVLLDVQQLIPLPQASEYQVRLRQKEQLEHVARQIAINRDYTKYTVIANGLAYPSLAKRRAALQVVKSLCSAGVSPGDLVDVLKSEHRYGSSVMRTAEGILNSSDFIETSALGSYVNRYFCLDDELIHFNGSTYALTSQWGDGTFEAIRSLLNAFSNRGVSCEVSEPTA